MTIRRARYQCSATGRLWFPLDEQLELPRGEVTAALAQRVSHLATHMSFAELQRALPLYFDLRLCASVLNRLVQRVGGVAARDEAAQVARLAAAPVGAERTQQLPRRRVACAPARLYISADGVLYPTRNREEIGGGRRRAVYQEMKCGAVFWERAPQRGEKHAPQRGEKHAPQRGEKHAPQRGEKHAPKRWEKRVLNGREDVATFGLRLWALAVECGLEEADEVIFISDGGVWCETIRQAYFRDARRILDWYHAAEHVWAAARTLYPDEAAARRWAERCLDLLRDYSGLGLLRYLRRSRRARSGGAAPTALDELIGYLEPRVAFMDYYEYRAQNYVLGSGLMESTCKQIVGQRLKGSGRQWSETGALALATLISYRLNGDWDTFWSTAPLRRAA